MGSGQSTPREGSQSIVDDLLTPLPPVISKSGGTVVLSETMIQSKDGKESFVHTDSLTVIDASTVISQRERPLSSTSYGTHYTDAKDGWYSSRSTSFDSDDATNYGSQYTTDAEADDDNDLMILVNFKMIRHLLETHPSYKQYFETIPMVGIPGNALRNIMKKDHVRRDIVQSIPDSVLIKGSYRGPSRSTQGSAVVPPPPASKSPPLAPAAATEKIDKATRKVNLLLGRQKVPTPSTGNSPSCPSSKLSSPKSLPLYDDTAIKVNIRKAQEASPAQGQVFNSMRRKLEGLAKDSSNRSLVKSEEQPVNPDSSSNDNSNEDVGAGAARKRGLSFKGLSSFFGSDSSAKTPMTSDKLQAEQKRIKKKNLVLNEIVQTERAYVNNLSIVKRLFISPLKEAVAANRPIISEDAIAAIFVNMEVLLELNTNLLVDLERCAYDDTYEKSIGAIFLTYTPFFKIYSIFIDRCEAATEYYLKERKANKAFNEFCDAESITADPQYRAQGSQSLESFMIMPVQRIPRYSLLLSEMSKFTTPGTVETSELEKAIELIKVVASHCNHSITSRINTMKLIDLQKSFGDSITLIAPHRRLMHEGILRKQGRNGWKSYTFWLFNDILIYGDKKSTVAFHKGIIDLATSFITADFSGDSDTAMKHSFLIYGEDQSFFVQARDEHEKHIWVEKLNQSVNIARVTQHGLNKRRNFKGQMAPILQPLEEAKTCSQCGVGFGIMKKKDNCHRCGKVICSECSTCRWQQGCGSFDERELNKLSLKKICDGCFEDMEISSISDSLSQMNRLLGA